MTTKHDHRPSKQTYVFHPFEISFVGYSNAGKTTLITKVLRKLALNYSVGYVKHDAHTFTMDHKGKDTYKAWESGASEVFIADGDHTSLLSRGKWNPIQQKIGMIDCDCVIVEGYKNSTIDKIVMIDEEEAILELDLEGIVAFSGPNKEPKNLPPNLPYYQRDDVDGIVAFITERFCRKAEATPLYGLVLSGGYSTRMKSDKGLLNYHGRPQADHCYHLLAPNCEKVFVSTRQDQWDDNTLKHLPQLHDRFLGMGPLSGILTAMTTHPNAAWIILACDLPNVTPPIVHDLIAERNPYKMATAYLNMDGTFPEPLCAIYEPKIAIPLFEALAIGWCCPKKVLANVPIKMLNLRDKQALDNINTKDEYHQAKVRERI